MLERNLGSPGRPGNPGNFVHWLFDSRDGAPGRLVPRWIFLRALATIYFSAFYSLLFQIKGLIGTEGILPAHELSCRRGADISSNEAVVRADTLLAFLEFGHADGRDVDWPAGIDCRVPESLAAAQFLHLFYLLYFVCDRGAATFRITSRMECCWKPDSSRCFLCRAGFLPGLGDASPPSRASLFLLQWEWFRIYFESGMVKLLSGDRQWRTLTAMDEYYQNGPLPTWIGWYVQHLPHWFQAASAAGTLGLELGLVWMLFLPRRVRIVCFWIVTPWEFGVIFTANYTFLNYLVLSLGFLLLDDRFLLPVVPARYRTVVAQGIAKPKAR